MDQRIQRQILFWQWVIMSVLIGFLLISLSYYALNGRWLPLPINLETRLSSRFFFGYIALSLIYLKEIRSKDVDDATLLLLNSMFLALFLDGFGNAIDLYQRQFFGFYYDKYLHFTAPFILAIGFSNYIVTREFAKDRKVFVIIIASMLLFIGAVVFEIYEQISDLLIKTDMVKGYYDTLYDIVLDFLGISLGVILVTSKEISKVFEFKSNRLSSIIGYKTN